MFSNRFSDGDVLLNRNRFITLYMHSAVRAVEKDGDWSCCTLQNYSMQIWIRVFGMIHIHMGDGIGVGLFLGLFSLPALTLVTSSEHAHTHTHARNTTHRGAVSRKAARGHQGCIWA